VSGVRAQELKAEHWEMGNFHHSRSKPWFLEFKRVSGKAPATATSKIVNIFLKISEPGMQFAVVIDYLSHQVD
jgi:hypothetical protein